MEDTINREMALAFILQHEKESRRAFLKHAKWFLRQHEHLPALIREKFIAAGNEYGVFKINQPWVPHMESEIWDGVMYAGLDRYRRDLFSLPPHNYDRGEE